MEKRKSIQRPLLERSGRWLAKVLPPKFKGLVDRFLNGKAGPADAIRAKCLECSGGSSSEAARCEVDCPLLAFNPYRMAAAKRQASN